MYAQSDIRSYRTPWFGGTPWQKNAPIDAYWNNSPLKDVANVKTPTLFFVGEQDPRVPMPQSLEMYRALKSNGVPTHLYVAPREPHGWGELRHQLSKLNAEIEWFEKYATKRPFTPERAPGDEKKDAKPAPISSSDARRRALLSHRSHRAVRRSRGRACCRVRRRRAHARSPAPSGGRCRSSTSRSSRGSLARAAALARRPHARLPAEPDRLESRPPRLSPLAPGRRRRRAGAAHVQRRRRHPAPGSSAGRPTARRSSSCATARSGCSPPTAASRAR